MLPSRSVSRSTPCRVPCRPWQGLPIKNLWKRCSKGLLVNKHLKMVWTLVTYINMPITSGSCELTYWQTWIKEVLDKRAPSLHAVWTRRFIAGWTHLIPPAVGMAPHVIGPDFQILCGRHITRDRHGMQGEPWWTLSQESNCPISSVIHGYRGSLLLTRSGCCPGTNTTQRDHANS